MGKLEKEKFEVRENGKTVAVLVLPEGIDRKQVSILSSKFELVHFVNENQTMPIGKITSSVRKGRKHKKKQIFSIMDGSKEVVTILVPAWVVHDIKLEHDSWELEHINRGLHAKCAVPKNNLGMYRCSACGMLIWRGEYSEFYDESENQEGKITRSGCCPYCYELQAE